MESYLKSEKKKENILEEDHLRKYSPNVEAFYILLDTISLFIRYALDYQLLKSHVASSVLLNLFVFMCPYISVHRGCGLMI